MRRLWTREGGPGAGRPPWVRRGAWATAPAVLAGLAVWHPGAPISQLDLHDGTVWLTNASALSVGRYNPAIEELNAGLGAQGTPFNVLQDGFDVLLVQPGAVALVDPASVSLGGQTAVAFGSDVSMGGGTTAVVQAADGAVWAKPTQQIGALRVDADPDLELGQGGRAVVTRDGVVLGVAADGAVHRLTVTAEGSRVEEAGRLAGSLAGEIEQITAVGDTVAVLAGGTVHTPDGTVALGVQGEVRLQQPGPRSGAVLVGTTTALLEVPLDGGKPTVHPTGGPGGRPAQPVRVAGCAHGAWSAPVGNYLRVCGTAAPEALDLTEVASTDELVFRVNRDAVVLNSVRDGRLWLPTVDPAVREPNWTDIEQDTEDVADDREASSVTTEALDAECTPDSAPPSAVDDEFGVRPGRTVLLPVVANDSSASCGMLVISDFDPIDEDFGALELVHGGRAFQLTAASTAAGATTFTYTVTDGRGASAPSTATVTLTARPDGENGAPVQVRTGALVVEQGGTATYDVLADFADPDGDPMVLVSAVGTGGQARARGDGRLRFQADGSALGRQTVALRVSDGTATVDGELFVDIRPAGSAPPVLEPLLAVTYVDESVTVDALSAVRSHGREPVRLAAVETVAGLDISADLDAGRFTVTSRNPGTFYVPFTVVAPPQQATGLLRLDVRERPEVTPPPVAVLDVALLPAGGEVTIDPLANDVDPAGGVLVVQSVDVPPTSGLRVAIVQHGLLRIAATRTLDAPVVVGYVLSNGTATAVGQVVVQPVPPAAGQQPPVVQDVTATVRTGGVVTIPVLEHAFDPDGDPLTLERRLVEAPGAGFMFVSGDVLRFQAPATPGQVRATFEVTDTMLNRTAATVTIEVHASDEDAKPPPRPLDLVARTYAEEEVVIDVPLVGIDTDGDGVSLLGIARAPERGIARMTGSSSLTYQALPGEVGTDTFTYAVEDWAGQRAVATVRVGIAPRPTGAAPVLTRDDAAAVRPGQRIEVRVLANDESSGGGTLTLDPVLQTQPADVSAEVAGDRVVVETPSTEGVLQILYTARNARGGQDTGLLTVTVAQDAPILPPVAADVVVPAADTIAKTAVAVDVLALALNPSGPLSDLQVEMPPSAGTAGVVQLDGTVLVTLADRPQTIPYLLRNTHPQAEGVSSYAFITVPALGDFPPMHRRNAGELSVIGGEPLVIELGERVRVAPGRSPRIGDRASVVATKADGSPVVVDDDTLRYTARADYSGPASLTLEVADGPLSDPTVHTATLTFPITVLAREEHPPTFTPSVLEVPQADTVRVDLTAFTSSPASVDEAAAERYTYRLAGTAPGGFDVALTGPVLTVSAAVATPRGTVVALPLTIDYGGAEPLEAQVDVRVVASRLPLARVQSFTVPDGVEGGESAVPVLDGAYNPLVDRGPLGVVSAEVETPGAGTARVVGSSVVVNPASGYIGQLVARFSVRDATGDLDRLVEGRITVIVRGRPGTPVAPHVVEARDRSVQLAWDAPANNGEPIDRYRVTASGGIQQECASTACTITGLTNDVTYTFTVAAHNAVGWSDPSPASGEARPDTQPMAPGTPVVERADRRLTVRWDPPENPGSPIVEYDVTITPPGPRGATMVTRSTSLEIDGLANGQRYAVQVRARNSAPAPGAWSPEAYGTPARAPDAPDVSATRTDGRTTITVAWHPGADGGEPIDRFEVAVDGATVHTAGPGEREYTFPADRGRRYTVAVRAGNAVGWSSWADSYGQIYGQPTAVQGLTLAELTGGGTWWGQGALRASWSPPADAGGDGIGIERYDVVLTDRNGSAVRTQSTGGTAVDFGNLLGGTYTVTVTAISTVGVGGEAAAADGATVTVPGAPVGLAASSAEGVVTVTWSAPGTGGSPLLEYRVRVDGAGEGVAHPATSTTYQLPDTYPPGTWVTVEVWAVNADGPGRSEQVGLEIPGAE